MTSPPADERSAVTATPPPAPVRIHHGVLRCSLSTREAGGSLNAVAVKDATTALAALGTEGHGIGAVLLTSDGPNFCTGGDIREFARASEDRAAHVLAMAQEFHQFVRALRRTPVPVVAAVSGWAAGAGMSIACLADIIVVGPATRFRPAYPSIGFSPDGGLSWTLPRLIGASWASDVLITDRVLTGEEALATGLATRVVPDDRVRDEGEALAARLAQGPTGAYATVKKLLRDAPHQDLPTHLDHEAASIAASAEAPEGRAGVEAFLSRRASKTGGDRSTA